MRHEVFIRFSADQETAVPLGASDALPPEQARRWLDEQFIANDCEPLRASGKVLTADKLLAIATTVGAKRFETDAEFRVGFARAASGALGKPVVRVDVETNSIAY
ncbi:hypothetical protein [Ideonella sp. A 288]|uniref:hypothetical protein n=1 Tax=Ideonella sp. A 288 TaxID=1962181 RepID=UPI000B4BD0C6|nr:hypothetical protein [Ideonella sp. A 288]